MKNNTVRHLWKQTIVLIILISLAFPISTQGLFNDKVVWLIEVDEEGISAHGDTTAVATVFAGRGGSLGSPEVMQDLQSETFNETFSYSPIADKHYYWIENGITVGAGHATTRVNSKALFINRQWAWISRPSICTRFSLSMDAMGHSNLFGPFGSPAPGQTPMASGSCSASTSSSINVPFQVNNDYTWIHINSTLFGKQDGQLGGEHMWGRWSIWQGATQLIYGIQTKNTQDDENILVSAGNYELRCTYTSAYSSVPALTVFPEKVSHKHVTAGNEFTTNLEFYL